MKRIPQAVPRKGRKGPSGLHVGPLGKLRKKERSVAVDEFATSYPLAIGWMVGNSESRTSTGNEHIYINERIGKSTPYIELPNQD